MFRDQIPGKQLACPQNIEGKFVNDSGGTVDDDPDGKGTRG